MHYRSTGCVNVEGVGGKEVAIGNIISIICIKR